MSVELIIRQLLLVSKPLSLLFFPVFDKRHRKRLPATPPQQNNFTCRFLLMFFHILNMYMALGLRRIIYSFKKLSLLPTIVESFWKINLNHHFIKIFFSILCIYIARGQEQLREVNSEHHRRFYNSDRLLYISERTHRNLIFYRLLCDFRHTLLSHGRDRQPPRTKVDW